MKTWSECDVQDLRPGNCTVYQGQTVEVTSFPKLDNRSGRVSINTKELGFVSFNVDEEVEVYR